VSADEEAIREAQAIIRRYVPDPHRSLVDELIAERRKEAERDAREERARDESLGQTRAREGDEAG
jgi:hypothetical protein